MSVTQTAARPVVMADPNQPKPKRKRSPSVAKPAYLIMQVLDESGEPMTFSKKRLRVLAVERDAGKVLQMTDGGENPNTFHLAVMVPGGSRAGSPNKPKE